MDRIGNQKKKFGTVRTQSQTHFQLRGPEIELEQGRSEASSSVCQSLGSERALTTQSTAGVQRESAREARRAWGASGPSGLGPAGARRPGGGAIRDTTRGPAGAGQRAAARENKPALHARPRITRDYTEYTQKTEPKNT